MPEPMPRHDAKTPWPPPGVLVAPSLLAADFTRLGADAAAVQAEGADWLHLDVMDGHFVPNISFGPLVLQALRPGLDMPFDVHLMISPVDAYIPAFAAAGADHIIVHPEAGPHIHRSVQLIRSLGKRAGVALNPGTPVEAIEPLLDSIDLVLAMSVNPGFGGQAFLPGAPARISRMRDLIGRRPIALAVDGGITAETAPLVVAAGAQVLIAGTAVFQAKDRRAAIAALRGPAAAGQAA